MISKAIQFFFLCFACILITSCTKVANDNKVSKVIVDGFELSLSTESLNYDSFDEVNIGASISNESDKEESLYYLSYVFTIYDSKGQVVKEYLPTSEDPFIVDIYGSLPKGEIVSLDLKSQIDRLTKGKYSVVIHIEMDLGYSNPDGSPDLVKMATQPLNFTINE